MADWVSIKTEYISTQISTRDLAQKHGVKYSTLRDRALREQWSKARSDYTSMLIAKTEQKTAEAVSDAQAERVAELMSAGAKAARMLSAQLDRMEETGKVKTYEVKAITESLKNIRDLYKDNAADRQKNTMEKLDDILKEMRDNAVDA